MRLGPSCWGKAEECESAGRDEAGGFTGRVCGPAGMELGGRSSGPRPVSPWLAGSFSWAEKAASRRARPGVAAPGSRGRASPVRCPGPMAWLGPRGFQSLLPRSLRNRGGTLPSSALWGIRVLELPGCELADWERVWHPRVTSQGCLSPSSLLLHHTPQLSALAAPQNTMSASSVRSLSLEPPGSASEILSRGTESRGSLRGR